MMFSVVLRRLTYIQRIFWILEAERWTDATEHDARDASLLALPVERGIFRNYQQCSRAFISQLFLFCFEALYTMAVHWTRIVLQERGSYNDKLELLRWGFSFHHRYDYDFCLVPWCFTPSLPNIIYATNADHLLRLLSRPHYGHYLIPWPLLPDSRFRLGFSPCTLLFGCLHYALPRIRLPDQSQLVLLNFDLVALLFFSMPENAPQFGLGVCLTMNTADLDMFTQACAPTYNIDYFR